MSESMRLYHGSPIRVPRPLFGVGNPYNDYGLGFYCTESLELACEWACPKAKDGFANAYDLALDGLNIVDLDAEPYGTIEWLAVLFANRQFDVATNLMEAAKSYVAARYPAELGKADVIIGYRADDSYFSFARAFLENRISLAQLERAMKLGGLGRQVVAVSEAASEPSRSRVPKRPRHPSGTRGACGGTRGPGAISIAFCTKSPLIPPACTCST